MVHEYIADGGPVFQFRTLSGELEGMDWLQGVPEWKDFQYPMLATPIHNTLYGCKNWRLGKANAHRIQPDEPERDAPEENSRYELTVGAGQMANWEP